MKRTFVLLITLALAASCVEQEVLAPAEPTTPGSDVLIVPGLSIGASVSGEATSGYSSASAMTGGRGTTRVTTYLYDNFPDAAGSNVATLWGYTSTNALGSENLIPPTIIKNTANGFELATSQYYPADGAKKLYFYAHAPHDGGIITTGDGATVEYNGLDGQKDVMWAKDVRGIAKNTDPTQQEQPFFVFQHKLMQLRFKVVADASFEANKTVTNITVKSVSTNVKMRIKDGSTTFSGSGNISINPTTGNTITTSGTTLAEAMMVAPGSAVTLSVTAGGITFPDITLTGLSAQAGISHLITLTFKRAGVATNATLTSWSTVQSSDIDVDKDGTN